MALRRMGNPPKADMLLNALRRHYERVWFSNARHVFSFRLLFCLFVRSVSSGRAAETVYVKVSMKNLFRCS